jgi:selenide,water dikinase
MPINVLSTATIGRILEGGASVCRAAGIPIAGGHTIDSVEAIYGLVALGLVHPKHVKRNADARAPATVLVLGKPLGVGVMSAALKKGQLGDAGYAQMIASTTKLNTPGPGPGGAARRARADRRHRLRPGRPCAGDGARRRLRGADRLGRRAAAARRARARGQGFVTGASGRNWAGYGADVTLPDGFAAEDRALLTDPQTSGGLLVACAPTAVDAVIGLNVKA